MASNGRQRIDEFVPEALIEVTKGVDPTWTGELVGSITSVDRSSMQPPMVDDNAFVTDGGAQKKIKGLSFGNVSAPLGMKAEGIQTTPADGVTAADTFQTLLASLAYQAVPNLTDTDTVAASPVPDVDGFTVTTTGSQDATGNNIFAFETSAGVYEARPGINTADAIVFLMTASAAPLTTTGIVPGSAQLRYAHKPIGRTAAMHLLGNDQLQHRYLNGVVTGMELPDFSNEEVPQLNFTLQAFEAEERPAASDTRQNPTQPSGKVFAGGDVLIGSYGDTDALSVCSSTIGLTGVGGGFLPDSCGNTSVGIADWGVRPAGQPTIKIKVPHNVVPSSITGKTSATWRAALNAGGAEVEYHIFFTVGQNVPGFSQSHYMAKAFLTEVGPSDANEQDANELTFMAGTGMTANESALSSTWW